MQKYLYRMLNEKLLRENNNKDRIKIYPFHSVGKVVYSPSAKSVCDPTWVIIECDKQLMEYYKWFLTKKGVKLGGSLWGSHISAVRGGTWDAIPEGFESNWGFNNGEPITFYYGDLVTNGVHWWLEVHSPELEDMRRKLGLKPHPDFGFHVTIGKIADL